MHNPSLGSCRIRNNLSATTGRPQLSGIFLYSDTVVLRGSDRCHQTLGSFCRWVKGSSFILNGISIEIEVEQSSFVIQPKKCENCVKRLGETKIFEAIRSTNW